MARRSPIDWAIKTVIPPPGMTPSRAWVSANRARSEATRKVHCNAISSPAGDRDAVDRADDRLVDDREEPVQAVCIPLGPLAGPPGWSGGR